MSDNVIRMYPECPVDMVLAYTEGRVTKNGKMQFSSRDGRVLFVPQVAGRQIEQRLRDLRIQAGDRVMIRETVDHAGGERTSKWEVFRCQVGVGQQANGSFVVPAQPGADLPHRTSAPTSKSAALTKAQPETTTATNGSSHTGLAAIVREHGAILIDVYADLLRYAREQHADVNLSPADIRELVQAAYAGLKANR